MIPHICWENTGSYLSIADLFMPVCVWGGYSSQMLQGWNDEVFIVVGVQSLAVSRSGQQQRSALTTPAWGIIEKAE